MSDKETIDAIVNVAIGVFSVATASAVVSNFTSMKLINDLYEGTDNFLTHCSYKFSVKDKTKTTYEEYTRIRKENIDWYRSQFPL